MTIFLETVANCENFDHLAAIKQQWPLTQQNLNHLPLTNSLTCQGCRCSSCISRQSLVLTLNFLSSMTRNAFSPLHSLSILCFTPNPSSMLLYEDWLGCILQGKRFFCLNRNHTLVVAWWKKLQLEFLEMSKCGNVWSLSLSITDIDRHSTVQTIHSQSYPVSQILLLVRHHQTTHNKSLEAETIS